MGLKKIERIFIEDFPKMKNYKNVKLADALILFLSRANEKGFDRDKLVEILCNAILETLDGDKNIDPVFLKFYILKNYK